MSDKIKEIQKDILEALAHEEGEDGLYLNNLQVVHEEEERTPVRGSKHEILEALEGLIAEGRVHTNAATDDEAIIFHLSKVQ